MTLFSRLANFRCPRCGERQPAYPLLTTIPGGAHLAKLNDYAVCLHCKARLRLANRGSISTRVLCVGLSMIGGALSLLIPIALATALSTRFSAIVIVVVLLFSFFLSTYFVGTSRAKLVKRLFSVEAL